jgi:hypothetical protein
MLHAVPELLDALETRLLNGEDPAALLTNIRWSELVGWPEDRSSALALRQRISAVQTVVMGLQSPLRATLANLSEASGYGRDGHPRGGPVIAPRLRGKV